MSEFKIGNKTYDFEKLKSVKKADVDTELGPLFDKFDSVNKADATSTKGDGEWNTTEADNLYKKMVEFNTNEDKEFTDEELKNCLKGLNLSENLLDKFKKFIESVVEEVKPSEGGEVEDESDKEQQPAQQAQPTETKTKWQGQQNLTCRDASGMTKPIAGKLEINDPNFTDNPMSFTIVSSSSGNKFIFEYDDSSPKDKPRYKCVAMNNRACTSNDNYYDLQTNPETGAFEIVQADGDNYKKGLKFGAAGSYTGQPAQTPPVATPEATPEVTPEVTPVTTPVATPEATPVATPEELTADEIVATQNKGMHVAKMLFGYTDDNDQANVADNINDVVSEKNVVEFLRGFENTDKEALESNWASAGAIVGGYILGGPLFGLPAGITAANWTNDRFFEQMRTEMVWKNSENKTLMTKVAKDLVKFLENKNDNDLKKKIEVILAKSDWSEENAKAMDDIVAEILKKYA